MLKKTSMIYWFGTLRDWGISWAKVLFKQLLKICIMEQRHPFSDFSQIESRQDEFRQPEVRIITSYTTTFSEKYQASTEGNKYATPSI